jgi:hypothetical protein
MRAKRGSIGKPAGAPTAAVAEPVGSVGLAVALARAGKAAVINMAATSSERHAVPAATRVPLRLWQAEILIGANALPASQACSGSRIGL